MSAFALVNAPLSTGRSVRRPAPTSVRTHAAGLPSLAKRAHVGAGRERVLRVVAKRQDGGVYNNETGKIDYGVDWYAKTKGKAVTKGRTPRQEMERRREANQRANNGQERKDLYTENWNGSEWNGGGDSFWITVGALFIITPIVGLLFAYKSYGVLWG